MAKNKLFQRLALFVVLLFSCIISNAENEGFKYYDFDKDYTVGVKIEKRTNGKTIATIINKNAENIKDSFFTNNLSEADFNTKLKSFLLNKMSVDSKDDEFDSKLSNLTYRIYITVPTNTIAETTEKQSAVTLHVKRGVRLVNIEENKLHSRYILNDILNYSFLEMKKLQQKNAGHLYAKKSMVIKGPLKKNGNGDLIHNLEIPGFGNIERKVTNQATQRDQLTFKPFESVIKEISYTEDINNVSVDFEYDHAAIAALAVGESEISVKVSYTIEAKSLPFLSEITKLDSNHWQALVAYSEKHKLSWKESVKYIGEEILNASPSDYTYLREQLSRIEINTPSTVTSNHLQIRNVAQLYELSSLLVATNKCDRQIDAILMSFIDRFKSKNNLLFEVENVKMVINSGRIEDMTISGRYNGNFYVFGNKVPIGFSSKHNIKTIFPQNQILFTKDENGEILKLPIRKVIDVDYSLFLNTKDFSPDDQEVNQDITDDNNTIVLTKDPRRELINLRAFTDLQGINENEPNGLIQLEISRQFNLWSTIRQACSSHVYGGLFTYIKPYFLLSKIEDKEKKLKITGNDSLVNGQYVPHKTATLIDIYKYQIFQTGTELNVFTVGDDHVKLRTYFDIGVQYFHTRYIDSALAKDNNTFKNKVSSGVKSIGAFNWYPQVKVQVSATDRIGIEGFWRFNFVSLLNRDIHLTTKLSEPIPYRANYKGYFFTYSAEVFYKPVEKDRVYARVTFNVQPNSYNNHFYQIQVGYNTALFLHSKN